MSKSDVDAAASIAARCKELGFMDERGNGARMSVYEPEDLGIGLPSRCLALSLRNLTTLWQSAGFAQDHTRGGTPW